MSGNPDGRTAKMIYVAVDGATSTFSYDTLAKGNTHQNMLYEQMDLTFTASSSSTEISFVGDPNNGAIGAALDNVRVYPSCCKTGGCMGDPRKLLSRFALSHGHAILCPVSDLSLHVVPYLQTSSLGTISGMTIMEFVTWFCLRRQTFRMVLDLMCTFEPRYGVLGHWILRSIFLG